MRNPYDILGVSQTASADEIRKAYRALAKTHHPDLNQGRPEAEQRLAEQRFKEVSAAYDLLSDPARRARFDHGEIDADGRERPPYGHAHHDFAGDDFPGHGFAGHGFAGGAAGAGAFAADDLQHIFADLFGGRGFGGHPGARARGGHLSLTLPLDFIEAAKGGRRRVDLPDGRTLDVDLPAGLEDGGTVRLKGQGLSGSAGGAPGDALITVKVRPHPWFRRDGDDIRLDLPVTLAEAVLGGKVRVPTIDGTVMLTVPKGANNGTVLRLKGKGIPDPHGGRRGDQYVTLRVALPETPDPALEDFVRGWAPAGYDPRRAMEAGT